MSCFSITSSDYYPIVSRNVSNGEYGFMKMTLDKMIGIGELKNDE